MERKELFASRLKQARNMRGMSLQELSDKMDSVVTRQAIHKYEQGKMMPDSKALIALSSALDVKVDFFFRAYSVKIGNVDFRKKSKFSRTKANSLKERVQEEMERYMEIEALSGETVPFRLSKEKVQSLEEVIIFAGKVRNSLNLGKTGISNVIEVLEDNGIKVMEIDEEESFDGLCGYVNNEVPIIVINSRFTPERKRFTVLHELGHLLMSIPDITGSKEKESLSNAFANEMLVPFSVLEQKIGQHRHDISLGELIDIQKQFGISIDALMYILHQQGVISDSRYKTFHIKKNTNVQFKNDVLQSRFPAEHSGRFARLVFRSLANSIISISKAASLLNVPVEKVHSQFQLV